VHFISTDLGKQLHVAHRSEQEASLVELFTKLLRAFLFDDVLGVCFPVAEQFLGPLDSMPLVHPAVNNCVVTVTLLSTYSTH